MERLAELLNLVMRRKYFYSLDLFNKFAGDAFDELTERINQLADTLSILGITDYHTGHLSIQFADESIFLSLVDNPTKSSNEDFIHFDQLVEINGKKVNLAYVQSIEEHKKAQEI